MGHTPNHHGANRRPQGCANDRANQQSQREGLAVSAWTRTAINAKEPSAITFSYMAHAGRTRLEASHPKTGSAVIHLPLDPKWMQRGSCYDGAGSAPWRIAGRDFLMRLVVQHGLAGAARMLRALADELAFLSYRSSMVTKGARPSRPRH